MQREQKITLGEMREIEVKGTWVPNIDPARRSGDATARTDRIDAISRALDYFVATAIALLRWTQLQLRNRR